MERERYLECLAADYARLREVAATADPTAKVPTCPEWTVADLTTHVATVYWHKAECMRVGKHPEWWPPDTSGEDPVALLDRTYQDLSAEFAARASDSPAYTWYEPDQTVGFWIRRMAQESVIHRVDGELGAGAPVAPIPDDLALDGIDELVVAFLQYGSRAWPEEYGDVLASANGRGVRVESGGRAWLIRPTAHGIEGRPARPDDAVDAVVSGGPAGTLLWLWNRTGDDAVTITGDTGLVTYLKRVLAAGTQ